MNYIIELNGIYSLSNINKGRVITENEDKEWCEMWVDKLNENPFKEGYLTEKQPTFIGFGYTKR